MEQSIFDFITAQAQAAYWNDYIAEQSEAPYLGEELFPDKKQTNLKMSYIKGANGLAKVAPLSAFDVKVLRKDRIGFAKQETEMPFFKLAMGIDETLRQELLMAEAAGEQYYQEVLRRIFDDNMSLLKDMSVARERMRMQLLTTGAIVMESNGQSYKYDYELAAEQKVTTAKSWSDPEADIIGDIAKWQDAIEAKTGVRPTRMIMRRNVFKYLLQNEFIKNNVYVINSAVNGKVNISEAAVLSVLREYAKINSISIYDKMYQDEDGVTQYFIPEDLVVLLPEGNIGNTVFGTTPEEADLRASKIADVALVDTGVAISTYMEADPVRKDTKTSQVCLPSGENIDKIVIATIKAD